MSENRNMILAIVLSLLVLIGWQFLVVAPFEQQREKAQLAQSQDPVSPSSPAGAPGAPTVEGSGGTGEAPAVSREAALEVDPRVPIETAELTGSINLKGGKIDDLRLKDYHLSVDPTSPTVTLLSPAGAPEAYFAAFGFTASTAMKLPGQDTLWQAKEGARLTDKEPLILTFDNGEGLFFTRTIAVDDHSMFTIRDTVENRRGPATTLYPYGLVVRYGKPAGQGTYILHEGMIGVFGAEGLSEVSYDDLQEERTLLMEKVPQGWLGITDKYWASALIPRGGVEKPFDARFLWSEAGDAYQADYRGAPLEVLPGKQETSELLFFAGPKEVRRIDAYGETLRIERFDLMIDWGWFYFLTKPMFYLIDFLFHLVGNFGVAILLVTVLIKAAFFPLANRSYASMSKMKKIQPQMMALREQYKEDKVRQQQALMELYRQEKINPLAGCLPILIQIPVFFSLYKVLYVTIEMRHAPFFGWIQDLSAPDPTSLFNLFGLLPWDVPQFLLIGVWPLLMGVTMWVQMKLNPAPTDPTQAALFTWMPVIFTFMLASFPAGLVIYWAWNNLLSILQQGIIMRRQGVKIELWDNIKATFVRKKPEAPRG